VCGPACATVISHDDDGNSRADSERDGHRVRVQPDVEQLCLAVHWTSALRRCLARHRRAAAAARYLADQGWAPASSGASGCRPSCTPPPSTNCRRTVPQDGKAASPGHRPSPRRARRRRKHVASPPRAAMWVETMPRPHSAAAGRRRRPRRRHRREQADPEAYVLAMRLLAGGFFSARGNVAVEDSDNGGRLRPPGGPADVLASPTDKHRHPGPRGAQTGGRTDSGRRPPAAAAATTPAWSPTVPGRCL